MDHEEYSSPCSLTFSEEDIALQVDTISNETCAANNTDCAADEVLHNIADNREPSRPRKLTKKLRGQKRRIYSVVHLDPKKSSRRFRANDRERRRMRSLNGALEMLRQCIPIPKGRKRMTKLEILRLACDYIDNLAELLRLSQNSFLDSNSTFADTCMVKVINGLSVPQRIEMFACGRLWL